MGCASVIFLMRLRKVLPARCLEPPWASNKWVPHNIGGFPSLLARSLMV